MESLDSAAKRDTYKGANCRIDRPNILFCIADDWSYPHAGVYGDKVISTPAFDRIASEGVLFTNAFCAAPSCTASRGAVLTGQTPHRLDEGANLWSMLPKRFPVYPDLLEEAGYFVGIVDKGWGPGSVEAGGRDRNPAGPSFTSFAEFLAQKPDDKPFCFWLGSHRPHRPYEQGIGMKSGLRIEDVTAPPYLPDTPEVRSDILDYYHASMQYDAEVAGVLKTLDELGLADNTLVIVTSDNGWAFPRAKCNLYDAGTRMPMALRWPGRVKAGWTTNDFVQFTDFAPTFMEVAGLKPLDDMTGRSFIDLITEGKSEIARDRAYTERERHGNYREGMLSYPMRAVRTPDYLYIRNPRPHLWPASDPESDQKPNGRFGDIDGSPSKDAIIDHRNDEHVEKLFQLSCGKRPEEELYDLSKDPWQMNNVAGDPAYADAKKQMRADLDKWMEETGDPRAHGEDDRWDKYPYIK